MYHEVDTDLPNHKKSRRLAALLGERRAWTRIVELWLWANLYALDGDLSDMTDEDLAYAMGYRFESAIPKDIRKALISSGFLTQDGQLHGWSERAKNLKKKRLAMRKLRAARGESVTAMLPLSGAAVAPDLELELEHDLEHDPPISPLCVPCTLVAKELEELSEVAPRWTERGHIEKIHSRHAEHGVEKCLDVVRVVVPRLMRSDDFKRFARVDTLFGPKNFLKYLDEVKLARTRTHDPSRSGLNGYRRTGDEPSESEKPLSPAVLRSVVDYHISKIKTRLGDAEELAQYPHLKALLEEQLTALEAERAVIVVPESEAEQ